MIRTGVTTIKRTPHTQEFREQALRKVRARGQRTQQSIVHELNISLPTLKGWLQANGIPARNGTRPSACRRCLKAMRSAVKHYMHGAAKKTCLSTSWRPGARLSARTLSPVPMKVGPCCANCNPSTSSSSVNCAAKTKPWRRLQKKFQAKSIKLIGRTRSDDARPAAQPLLPLIEQAQRGGARLF